MKTHGEGLHHVHECRILECESREPLGVFLEFRFGLGLPALVVEFPHLGVYGLQTHTLDVRFEHVDNRFGVVFSVVLTESVHQFQCIVIRGECLRKHGI